MPPKRQKVKKNLSGFLGRWGRKKDPAAVTLETERNFRKIIGHENLWMLKAVLDEERLISDKSQNYFDKDRSRGLKYERESAQRYATGRT